VLSELGCDVVTLNGQRDGRFPGRPSEPTRETLGDLSALVEATDASVGIARRRRRSDAAVDETGSFVPKDVLLALFARETATDGDVVAAPVDTSMAVDDALAAVGASVSRTRVGDTFVADRATQPNVVFGGEPSGAWIWPDETLCPDGPSPRASSWNSLPISGRSRRSLTASRRTRSAARRFRSRRKSR